MREKPGKYQDYKYFPLGSKFVFGARGTEISTFIEKGAIETTKKNNLCRHEHTAASGAHGS